MSEQPPTTGTVEADDDGPAADLHRSPLHDEHVALGATIVGFAGWDMPLRYTSDLEEHRAVREAAGLFDLSHMAEIRLAGPGAARALDLALVGTVSTLAVGRARYSMLCTPQGGVVDDLIVYRIGEQELLVVANAANHLTVVDELERRCAGPGVEVVDESFTTALVAIQGPAAQDVLTALVADPAERDQVAALRYYACLSVRVRAEGREVRALVARTGYTGEDGFELYVGPGDAAALWRALLTQGRPAGLVPAGLACRDSLRLEAGMPLYGHELDRTTTPYDAGLGRIVALGKADEDGNPLPFVGREALAARAQAQPSRTLVGLQGLSRRAARQGYPVLAGPGGAVVGEVTSGAPSPTLGHPVAMAYVSPEVSTPGTSLVVDVRGRAEPVRVVPLPFYRRPSST